MNISTFVLILIIFSIDVKPDEIVKKLSPNELNHQGNILIFLYTPKLSILNALHFFIYKIEQISFRNLIIQIEFFNK